MSGSELAFRADEQGAAGLEVRVNFGMFAGRNATQAEIDDLARELHDVVPSFEIVAEERHEFGDAVEATVRQIVITAPEAEDAVARRVVGLAERWAEACISDRAELGELEL